MNKIFKIIVCFITVCISFVQVQASSLDFFHPDLESEQTDFNDENEIFIYVDGDGSVDITIDENAETYYSTSAEPLELTISGNDNQSVSITANGNDDCLIAMWGVFEEDESSYSVIEEKEQSYTASFQFQDTRLMQISFATEEQINSYNSVNVSRKARAITAPSSLFEKGAGYTFSGKLTIENDDIYADTFKVSYVDGELSQLSSYFSSGEITLHCLVPGDIAPTTNISVYGLYAPIYHTYHATITKIDYDAQKLWISVYTDPLKTANGNDLKGYNGGKVVGYQTVGRTEQYGGEIELELPQGQVSIEKIDTDGSTVIGAHLVLYSGNKVIDEWDTDGTNKVITASPGTYRIEETVVPEGYIKALPVEITIESGKKSVYSMKDGRIGVIKKNQVTDEVVSGVHFVVKDENNEIVDEWYSTNDVHYVSNLIEGQTYTLIEQKPANGYEQMNPITLKADCNETQIIRAYNMPKKILASVIKVDQFDNKTRLQGAEFTLFYGDGTVATLINGNPAIVTTDYNGEANFDVYWNSAHEEYYIMETKAPEGYINTHEGEKIPVSSAINLLNTSQKFVVKDTANTSIQILKVDQSTGGAAQGNTTLQGATYEVYDSSTGKSISELGLESTLTIGSDGFSNVINYLPFDREYYALETKAPEGYILNTEKIPLKLNECNLIKNKRTLLVKTEDEIVHGSLEIIKHYNKKQDSQIDDDYEEGATFAVILNKYIEKYRTVEEAVKHIDEYTKMEYAIVTTDKNGYAKTGNLAYGKYTVKQISATDPESILCEDTYDYEVKGTYHNPIETISFTNYRREYSLTITKRNLETGRKITFSSALFKVKKIKDANGNTVNEYVSQKIGTNTYDVFKTVSMNPGEAEERVYFSANEPSGEVTTPLTVTAGEYQIEEIDSPNNFILSGPIVVSVNASAVTEVSEDDTAIKNIDIYDERAYGKLIFSKYISETDHDVTLIDRNDLSGIEYSLIAKENIVNPEDGSIITKKGKVYQSFNLSKDGTAVIEKIPLGKYILKETKTSHGILLSSKTYDVTFTQNDKLLKEYPVVLEETDDTILMSFSKTDPNGKYISGATLVIKDELGNEVLSFVSKDQPYIIEGLDSNRVYTLEEKEVPEGYVKSESIVFKPANNSEIQMVSMCDGITTIEKLNDDGELIKNAELQVVDAITLQVVDHWETDGKSHAVSGLIEGKDYLLQEVNAPQGYVRRNDIHFTATKSEQNIQLVNTRVRISKQDFNGNNVIGAHLTITDEDGNVVDEYDTDEGIHYINNLIEGHKYTITETYAPNGYYYCESTTFVASGRHDQIIEMIDANIRYYIKKVDDHGESVSGVTLTLYDLTDEKEVDSWVTTDEEKEFSEELIAEHEYKLTETEIVNGVYRSQDLIFKVDREYQGTEIHIQMIDELSQISIRKVDENGETLKGAKFEIYEVEDIDENGNITLVKDDTGNPVCVYSFVSSEESEDVSSYLNTEKQYLIHETAAPSGYSVSDEIVFTITGNNENHQIIMVKDTKLPNVKTGYQSDLLLKFGIFFLSLFGMLVSIFMIRTYR